MGNSKIYNKYKVNIKDKTNRTYKNIVYHSAMEMRFYRDWIEPKINNGEIIDCIQQVKCELQPKFKYNDETIQAINHIIDFMITYKDGTIEYIDVKGNPPLHASMKAKMFKYKFPEKTYLWLTESKIDSTDTTGWATYDIVKKIGYKESAIKA